MEPFDGPQDREERREGGVPSMRQEDYRSFHRKPRPDETPALSEADRTAVVGFIEALKAEHTRAFDQPEESEVASKVASNFGLDKIVTPSTIAAIAAAAFSGFGVYYGVKSDLKDLYNKTETNRVSIDAMIANRDEFRKRFEPIVANQDRINDTQDIRIQNLTGSITQLRDSVGDLAKVANQTHEDMAVMKSLLQQRSSGPRGN